MAVFLGYRSASVPALLTTLLWFPVAKSKNLQGNLWAAGCPPGFCLKVYLGAGDGSDVRVLTSLTEDYLPHNDL